jgi:hypothetical protein
MSILMFQRVLPTLGRFVGRKTSAAPVTEERRVWVRHACALATSVTSTSDPEPAPIAARVRNVSRGGIMLIVASQIEAGDLIRIDLPADAEGGESAVLACVVRVNSAENGQWALNCTFSADLSEADWQLFDLEPTPPEAERRARIRYVCKAEVIYEVVGGRLDQRGSAQCVDISTGGVGFPIAGPVALGSLLHLELRDGGGHRVAVMLASAVSTRRTPDGQYLLGCNFMGELGDAQLRNLVKRGEPLG